MDNQEKPIPVSSAVIIAGLLIALAIIIVGKGNSTSVSSGTVTQPGAPTAQAGSLLNLGNSNNQNSQNNQTTLNNMRPVSPADHILGNPNAPVKIVEYSDLECPFCKQFQSTMQQAMSEYGDKIVWVYRQFPIASLHSKAPNESAASECANELGGNDVFWKYIDRVYQVTNSNNSLDPAQLPIIAQYVGLDVTKFNDCLASGKYAQKINADVQNATDTGGRGTPWTIVVASNGQKFPVQGAVPYTSLDQPNLKQIIDQALATK
jgi:protein-disulfide isomerase